MLFLLKIAMLKFIVVGLVGALAAAGGAFFSISIRFAPPVPSEAHGTATVEQVTTELTAVPVVAGGKINAYVVLRVSSTIDKSAVKQGDVVLVPYLSDAVFRAAFEFASSGVKEIKAKHIEELTARIAVLSEQRLGLGSVKAVNLEQFNLVPESQIRGNRLNSN